VERGGDLERTAPNHQDAAVHHHASPDLYGYVAGARGKSVVRDTLGGLIGFAFIATGFVLKLGQEERMLIEHFGDDYRIYRQEVPALIPRPSPRRSHRA
jgi:hypothetical protein